MLFSLFNNRRKQIIAEAFPYDWNTYLDRNVRLYRLLNTEEKERLKDIIKVLVHEKNWEGCRGLTVNDEMRVTIAAHAALLVVNMDHDYYANVESILIYPAGYSAVKTTSDGRIVSEVRDERLGEAWAGDLPIILSWPDVLDSGRGEIPGRNVALHEFAHKLDNRDGSGDGVPKLGSKADYDRWSTVMSNEFNHLVYRAANGLPSLIDYYGATSPAEFYAVSTETFFERPRELRYYHPDLYAVLGDCYRQDPAARFS